MSVIVNARDVLLAAASPRLLAPANAAIILDSTTPIFHVNTSGVADPTSIAFTARLIGGLEGIVTFSAVGGTLSSISGNTCALLYSNMPGATATVTATLVYRGTTFSSNVAIGKVVDGAGGAGSTGARGAGWHYASGGVWSDTAANTATPGENIVDDLVTIFNGTTFSETRKWNGTAWLLISSNVNGSLLTAASVADTALVALAASKITGQLTDAQVAALAATKITGMLTSAQIADLAAAKLTGQITETQITDNAISTPKILAGAVVTASIAAGAVTTEKLIVASVGSALNADPGFEDPSAWTGGTVVTLADGKVGNKAFRSVGYSATSSAVKSSPVDSAKIYRLRAWVRKSVGADGGLYLGAQMLDANGNNVPGPGGTFWYVGAVNATVPTTFTEYVGYFNGTGPALTASCKSMRPIALLSYTGTVGYMEIQDFRIEEVLPGTMIADGAITTNKIVANAITANEIAANAITSVKILAGQITAGKIASGSIVAGDIQGSTITGDKIAANTIAAGNIVAGTISAAEIAANTITAKNLVIANNDAVDPDTNFYDSTWWTSGGNWPASVVPYEDVNASKRRTLVFNIGPAINFESKHIKIEKGSKYRLRAHIFKGVGTAGAFATSFYVPGVAHGTMGIPRAATNGAWGGNGDFDWAAIPANTWTTYTVEVTAPTADDYFSIFHVGTITAGQVFLGYELVRMSGADLIVDGSVTAQKIITNGLIIRDNAGVAIVGLGVPLAAGYEASGTKNADVIVGGRNLYKKVSPFAVGSAASLIARSNSGFTLRGSATNNGIMRLSEVITKNGEFTVSFDVINVSGPQAMTLDFCDANQWTFTPTTVIQHLSRTFTVTNYTAAQMNFIDFNGLGDQDYIFTNFKVEVGNKETGWLPAPEDVAADISSAQTTADSASNGLATKLNAAAASTLTGTVTISTSGSILAGTTTNGSYHSPTGFFGVQGGVVKFSVPTSGDPTFAGQLSAAYGSFGGVTIAAGGSISSGQTAYNTGTGWHLSFIGGVPKLSIGSPTGNRLTFDGTNMEYVGGVQLAPFSATITGTLSTGVANSLSTTSIGTLTASVTGGRAPLTYLWIGVVSDTDPSDRTGVLSASADTNSVTGVSAKVSAFNTRIIGKYTLTVTDADNRVATATRNVSTQFGTAA